VTAPNQPLGHICAHSTKTNHPKFHLELLSSVCGV
jgi:hypothetical protein